MRNTRLVIWHEIVSLLGKRSFWLMTLLFPLLTIGLNVGTQVFSRRVIEAHELPADAREGEELLPIGYVDETGLIAGLPADVQADEVRAFPDEAAAQAALVAGDLRAYYSVPADFVDTGELVMVERTFRPLGSVAGKRLFEYLIYHNLVGEGGMAARVMEPVAAVESLALAPHGAADRDSPLAFWVPYAAMFVFFFVLTMSSTMMLQSVSKEKENRTAEVLLLSLRPRELMLGKVVGLGAVALFQIAVWTGGGMLLLGRGQQMLDSTAGFALPAGFAMWVVLYFLAGYLMYASAFAAVGAVAPTAREAAQFTFVLLLPLMIPLWMNTAFIEDPNGATATFLSLFPLSAPSSMVSRLAAGGVPLWQPIVGLIGVALTAYGLVLLSARFFRADTLLSSASLSWQRAWKELLASVGRRE